MRTESGEPGSGLLHFAGQSGNISVVVIKYCKKNSACIFLGVCPHVFSAMPAATPLRIVMSRAALVHGQPVAS